MELPDINTETEVQVIKKKLRLERRSSDCAYGQGNSK